MNKHLDVLKQLLIRYWDKEEPLWDDKWDVLSPSKKNTYIKLYIIV